MLQKYVEITPLTTKCATIVYSRSIVVTMATVLQCVQVL